MAIDPAPFADLWQTLRTNVGKVILGKDAEIERILVALLCRGHVLLDDVPGTGKTMLARAIATSLGGEFRRIQFTPDLLPNDVTGVSVYNQKSGEFEFRAGPVFANVLLADEINRATPRTQSALLEAMSETQVSADGVSRPLPTPFIVLATQNPVELEGTFPLPEAQLDRFMMRLSLGYPTFDDERNVLEGQRHGHPIDDLAQVSDLQTLADLQRDVGDVHVDGRHRGDGVAAVQRLFLRQHVVAEELQVHGALAEVGDLVRRLGQVAVRHHRLDAGQRLRLAGVDGLDARVRVRAAQHLAVQHAGQAHVGAVDRPAGHLVGAVRTHRARADYFVSRCICHQALASMVSAASRTARTILS